MFTLVMWGIPSRKPKLHTAKTTSSFFFKTRKTFLPKPSMINVTATSTMANCTDTHMYIHTFNKHRWQMYVCGGLRPLPDCPVQDRVTWWKTEEPRSERKAWWRRSQDRPRTQDQVLQKNTNIYNITTILPLREIILLRIWVIKAIRILHLAEN